MRQQLCVCVFVFLSFSTHHAHVYLPYVFCFSPLKVVAKNLMPDSLEPRPLGRWTESRVGSVRIVWPSMQYIDACREDM